MTQARALISPQIDFWLVGGASIVFFFGAWLLNRATGYTPDAALITVFVYAAFLTNYPHFAYSYQLFYADFRRYLRDPQASWDARARVLLAGVIVPVLMLGYFIYVGATQDMKVFSYSATLFWFFVGWHYVKQGFGVLITLSVYRKIFYNLWQKRILLANAYICWIYIWIESNNVLAQEKLLDLPLAAIPLPAFLTPLFAVAAAITTLGAVYALFHAAKIEKKGFCLNGVVGYLAAIYIWWPIRKSQALFFLCVPLFHALQYLPFVYKLEKGKLAEKRAAKPDHPLMASGFLFALTGIALGALFFEIVPRAIDHHVTGWPADFSRNFFLIAFLIFINIHHYFIDNAFWRKDNATVQKHLFSS